MTMRYVFQVSKASGSNPRLEGVGGEELKRQGELYFGQPAFVSNKDIGIAIEASIRSVKI